MFISIFFEISAHACSTFTHDATANALNGSYSHSVHELFYLERPCLTVCGSYCTNLRKRTIPSVHPHSLIKQDSVHHNRAAEPQLPPKFMEKHYSRNRACDSQYPLCEFVLQGIHSGGKPGSTNANASSVQARWFGDCVNAPQYRREFKVVLHENLHMALEIVGRL
jgi:hypothetical protein